MSVRTPPVSVPFTVRVLFSSKRKWVPASPTVIVMPVFTVTLAMLEFGKAATLGVTVTLVATTRVLVPSL
jgi:hypothetical protein